MAEWYSAGPDVSWLVGPVYRFLSANPGVIWASVGALLLFLWLGWPALATWWRERADRAKLEDPIVAEKLRVARLKQMDAYRQARKDKDM